MNSTSSIFSNDVTQGQLERRIQQEFDFFDDVYFLDRDVAALNMFFSCVGSKSGIQLKNEFEVMEYKTIYDNLLKAIDKNYKRL